MRPKPRTTTTAPSNIDFVEVDFIHVPFVLVAVHAAFAHTDLTVGDFVHVDTRRLDDLVDRRDDADDPVTGRADGFRGAAFGE